MMGIGKLADEIRQLRNSVDALTLVLRALGRIAMQNKKEDQ